MVIPLKFKAPKFDKYVGTACPENHLKRCYRKMGAYAKDEKLLMHFFQESHTGAAVTWYTNLEPSRVHSWKGLMVAFIRQYPYNSDMAPDKMQLQSMCMRGHESFKEYAPKVEGPGNSSSTSNDKERDDHIDRGHITSVLL